MEQTSRSNPRIDDQRKHETASLTHGAGVDARSRENFRDQDPAEAVVVRVCTGLPVTVEPL